MTKCPSWQKLMMMPMILTMMRTSASRPGALANSLRIYPLANASCLHSLQLAKNLHKHHARRACTKHTDSLGREFCTYSICLHLHKHVQPEQFWPGRGQAVKPTYEFLWVQGKGQRLRLKFCRCFRNGSVELGVRNLVVASFGFRAATRTTFQHSSKNRRRWHISSATVQKPRNALLAQGNHLAVTLCICVTGHQWHG